MRIVYLILSLLALSCEKVIPFSDELKEKKIVVNGIFLKDSAWKIHVSESKSVIDTTTLAPLNNATVFILNQENNQIDSLHSIGNGFYISSNSPSPGTYEFHLFPENEEHISSVNTLPAIVPAVIVDTQSFIQNNNNRLEISLQFNDPEYKKDFYEIAVKIRQRKRLIETNSLGQIDTSYTYKDKWLNLKSDDPYLEKMTNNNLIISDEFFDGSQQTLEFSIRNKIKELSTDSNNDLIFIHVYFFKISSSLYNYHRSLNTHINQSGSPFAQPIQVYSNIQNGIGIFAGSSAQKIILY